MECIPWRAVLLTAVCTLAFVLWCADIGQSAGVVPPGSEPETDANRNDGKIHVVAPLERTTAAELVPVEQAAAPAATQPPGPDAVALPTIDAKAAQDDQRQTLRMLAHAMADAGLPCAMPADLSKQSWEMLGTWLSPLQRDRKVAADRGNQIVKDEVADRLRRGRYEVRATAPDGYSENEYVGWRHAADARGNPILHVVRIARGEHADLDALRDRCKAIDRDVGILARNFFDRASR